VPAFAGAATPAKAFFMADEPTFAEQMVTRLEALLARCAGLQSVNVEGLVT